MTDQPSTVTIPRVIHQIWYQGADEIPDRYRAFAAGWQNAHPDWEYRLWDRSACRDLLAGRYPDFIPVWEKYPLLIQRIDSIRYFILNTHGGIYLDMDMECLKPLDPLFEDCDLILSRTIEYNIAAMAGIPGHPLWHHVMHRLVETSGQPRPRGLRSWWGGDARLAAETAGPIFFARMVRETAVDSAPRTRVCPGRTFEPRAPTLHDGRLGFDDDTGDSYAVHHEALGWMPWAHRGVSLLTRPLFRLMFGRRAAGRDYHE